MLHLSLGTEGRRIVSSRYTHLTMDTLNTTELWQIMEEVFIRPINVTFHRNKLLTTKQIKGKSIEHFYGNLKELSEMCKFGNQENSLIRDFFIANMQDLEIEKELLKETVELAEVLRLVINKEPN